MVLVFPDLEGDVVGGGGFVRRGGRDNTVGVPNIKAQACPSPVHTGRQLQPVLMRRTPQLCVKTRGGGVGWGDQWSVPID